MLLIIKALILAGLIRYLLNGGKPLVCAGVYTAVGLILTLLITTNLLVLLLSTALRFALAALYFWLLDRFEDNVPIFWLVAILGLLIGLV